MHLLNSPAVADWGNLPPRDLDALADVIRTCCRLASGCRLTSQGSPVRELARLHVTYNGHETSSREVCKHVVPVLLTAHDDFDFFREITFDGMLSNALKRQAVNEAAFLIKYGDVPSRYTIQSFCSDSIRNGRLESISLLLDLKGYSISPHRHVRHQPTLMLEAWKDFCLYGYLQNPHTSPADVFQQLKSHPAVFSPNLPMLKLYIKCLMRKNMQPSSCSCSEDMSSLQSSFCTCLLRYANNSSCFYCYVAARHQSSGRCSCYEAGTPHSPADLHNDFISCFCHETEIPQSPDSCSCHVDQSPVHLDGAFSGLEVLLEELKQHGRVVLGEAFIEACVAHHWRAMLLLLSWGISVNAVAHKKTALAHMIDGVLINSGRRPGINFMQGPQGEDPALTPGIIELLLWLGADTSFVNLDAYSCTHQSAAQYITSCCPQRKDVPPSLSHLLGVTSLKETALRAVIGRLVTVGLVHQPRGLCRLVRGLHTSGLPRGVRQLVTDRLLYILRPNM